MDANVTKRTEELAKELASQATTLDELNGVMRSLMKSTLETMLNSELNVHLGRGSDGLAAMIGEAEQGTSPVHPNDSSAPRNRKNGVSPKTVQGDMGKLPLDIPRDRNGTFEPPTNAARRCPIGKHQRRLAGFDEKILALYAKGLTTRDIQDIVKELYGVEISPTLISQITEDLDAEVKAWQTRRLDAVYPIVFLDGIVVHIRGRAPTEGCSRTCPRTHDVRRDRREFRGKE